MPIRFIIVALISSLALFAASCGGDESDLPTAEELYGSWMNVEDGVVRLFVFEEKNYFYPTLAGRTTVYLLYSYAEGADPVMVQHGTYEVKEGHLVTTVTWSPDPEGRTLGISYANILYSWSGDTFTLESTSAASGKRVFEATDFVPTP